jgi:hypothetical protein
MEHSRNEPTTSFIFLRVVGRPCPLCALRRFLEAKSTIQIVANQSFGKRFLELCRLFSKLQIPSAATSTKFNTLEM